jgi:hypothetical protein
MSTAIPIAAFADARTSLWGVFIGGTEPLLACSSLESGESLTPAQASLQTLRPEKHAAGQAAVWELRADDSVMTFRAAGDGAVSAPADGSLELCEVRGTATTTIGTYELNCAGVRLAPETGFESLRLVAAWFPRGAGVALLAVRPPGADGHEQDRVRAVLHGAGEGLSLFDPRLSTTYGGDGAPRRFGIELWLGENEEAELQLRRFAGEAKRPADLLGCNGLSAQCQMLAAHDADASGPGVYLLVRGE